MMQTGLRAGRRNLLKAGWCLMHIEAEPEHIRMLRDTLRRFVEQEMPRATVRQWDRALHFPRDVFARLAELGVCGLTIDEQYGGLGRDIVAAVVVVEELCRRGTSLGGPYIHCAFYGGVNISAEGTAEQKQRLLPRLARGEILFAYGLTEPNAGSDLASVTTTARRTGNGSAVLINGTKRWCTAAGISDYIYCLVRSGEADQRYRNLSFVLVPTASPGVTITPIGHLGLGYAQSTDVIFDDVEVPFDLVIGGESGWNNGWSALVGPALDVEKLELTAMALGIATAAVDDAWSYAQERTQFGKPIAAHQAIAHSLVNVRTRLAACRHMLYHAAGLANAGQPCSVESSMAKLFVTETAVDIVLECQRVMGAYGCSTEYDMERYARDILLMPIIGGSSNIQRNNIARRLRLLP
jgi:alkylation response protein AidB-like acyl-CoA dehydrogenase